jgi:serine/threonine protein kinase
MPARVDRPSHRHSAVLRGPAKPDLADPDASRCRISCVNRLETGSVLDGRYRLEAPLARGGFGAVWRATHLPSGVEVAVKLLHAELADDATMITRFTREAKLLSRLRHPHTISTYECGVTREGTYYIAMELLRGSNLVERIQRFGRVDWREVITIGRAICESLAEAHAHGIIHRDLKPANIHLEPCGGREQVKVIDFGIAKLLSAELGDDLTVAGQVLGTIEYMSPEQLIGGVVDGRSDMYALGVVLYELIAGARPFEGANGPAKLVTAMLTQTPEAPAASIGVRASGAAELDRVLLRCLARSPHERYVSIEALIAALDAIPLSGELARGSKWIVDPATIVVPEGEEITWIQTAPRANGVAVAKPVVTMPGLPVHRAARGSELRLPCEQRTLLMPSVPMPAPAPRSLLWVRMSLIATGVAIGAAVASLF